MGFRGLPTPSVPTLILLAALAPAVLAPVPARAAAQVRVDALLGFNGTAREGRFTPVILSIENPGGRIRAQVTLSVSWGARGGVPPGWSVTRDTVLDAGATRRLSFIIPFPRDVSTLQAVVRSQAAELGRFQADLRPLATPNRIVAGISSDLSFDGLSVIGGSASPLRVVYPRLDDLPQGWAGYDGVDAVVVHDTYFQQLRTDQVDALERWVVTGGVLVFTGGAAALQHEPAGFGRLLPVRVSGLVQRSGLPVAAAAGSERRMPGRVEVAQSTVLQGTVLASDGGLPVVVRRQLGRGAVWFLAFDPSVPPASAWDGTLSMWRTILEGDRVPALGAAYRSLPAESAIQDPWIAALLDSGPASFPPVAALLVFVGGYLALLVPLLAARRQRRMKGRVRLLLLGALSVCACLAAWVVFSRLLFRPGLQVVDAAMVDARSGDGLAVVTEKVAWFSASTGTVELRLGSTDAVVQAAPWRARPDSPWVQPHLDVDLGASAAVLRGLDLERMVPRLLAFQDVVAFPVSVHVQADAGRVEAAVTNGEAQTLLGCYFLVSGRAYPLGDIAAGGSLRKAFDESAALVAGEADRRRAALFKALEGEEDPAGRPPRLVGWLAGPVLPLVLGGARPVGDEPGLALVSVESE